MMNPMMGNLTYLHVALMSAVHGGLELFVYHDDTEYDDGDVLTTNYWKYLAEFHHYSTSALPLSSPSPRSCPWLALLVRSTSWHGCTWRWLRWSSLLSSNLATCTSTSWPTHTLRTHPTPLPTSPRLRMSCQALRMR